ncbi:hypothetical protein QTL95_07770 [Rhizobium sp. S152]|uniref:hypothetical protein n=1 Tax=Rhizobium sp. S152 TaxID=3055038 RepID=UPI0025A9C20F|nr:hypothetical protein [Rhizobium sp. S152]MDM9625789.1 hypothetical protein [Rhizobium sp. S152]
MHTHVPDTHIPDKRTEAADRMKRARPNRMKTAQVMPPHQVDLTLTPGVRHEMHVPAHVSFDLSRGGPITSDDSDDATIAKPVR